MEYPLDELAARVAEVPDETGVYLFKADGVPVYVGKAASLKKRLSSYLKPPAGADPKTLERGQAPIPWDGLPGAANPVFS